MKKFILNLSRFSLVGLITLFAIFLANLFNYIISIYFTGEFTRLDLIRSTLIPLVMAPAISWYLVQITFHSAKMEKQLKRLNTYDSLTQLFSRTAYLKNSKAVLSEAKSFNKSFSIMVIDLDNFKGINDNFGHDAGDHVLYRFGELIRNLGISNHLCGRIGGEEFAFTLINMDVSDTERFAELIREKLLNTVILYNNHEIKVTTSIGISSYKGDDATLHDLIVQADKALYQAKRNGRNRTLVFEENHSFKADLKSPA